MIGKHYRQNRQIIGIGEIKVALVMRRAPENSTRAIFHQYEIGDIDRQFTVCHERMPDRQTGVITTFLGGFYSCFRGAETRAFCKEFCCRIIFFGNAYSQGVVRSNGNKGRAIERVGPSGENTDPVRAVTGWRSEVESDLSPLRLADPVGLHQSYTVRPAVQPVDGSKKIISIFGNFQKPLRQQTALDHRAGTPPTTVDNLFICKDRIFNRVPVHPAFLAIGQPLFQKAQKHLLFMLIIIRCAGGQFAVPVIGQSHAAQLRAHGCDVLYGPGTGMGATLNRSIFGRQTEGIPTHGMKNIESPRTPVPRHHIAKCVVAHMPHMDAP